MHIPTGERRDFEIIINFDDTTKTQNKVELLFSNTKDALSFLKSVLQIRLKIVKTDDDNVGDMCDLVTFVNNIGSNVLSYLRLTATDSKIEHNLYAGISFTIEKKSLTCSDDFSRPTATLEIWYPETSDSYEINKYKTTIREDVATESVTGDATLYSKI